MDLYVIRHAIAEERRFGLDDERRALTERGIDRFQGVVGALTALEVRFDTVLHSPWLRAAQTAGLLEPVSSKRQVEEGLARDPDEGLLEAIRAAGGCVAVVGHEPWLSMLVAQLMHGDPDDPGVSIRMKKGGVAQLRGVARLGQMQLRALLPPRVLLA